MLSSPPSTPIVDATISFAPTPAIRLTSSCHVKPCGANSGAMSCPIRPIYDVSIDEATPAGPKYPSAHTIMLATRMTPPIFFRYSLPFSHVWRPIAFGVGQRYGGSSITNGVSSPFSTKVEKILLTMTATKIPMA